MATNVSNVVKHFPSAQNGFTTTTSGSVSSGATTVGLNSVAGYSNGEVAVFIIDPSNSKKQTFTGTIDTGGSQVTGVVWTAGSNTAHDAGATVVDYETATHWSMVSKGILVHADQDGTLTAGAVDNAAVLASDVVTTAKILDSNVTTSKIADNNVTTAKILNDNVTDAKLVYGKVRSRQGGSATNWSTTGTTTYDYSGTDTFVQVGSAVGTAGSFKTVTFPTAFNQVPLVIVSMDSASSFSCMAIATSQTTTTFQFACIAFADSGAKAETINWIAIGE